MGLLVLLLAGLACAAGLIGFVYYQETHLPPAGAYDVIIVLGAQVKADGTPSEALRRRLTVALESYQGQLIIACGAQGANEPCAEGDLMRDWLLARGVPPEDVISEPASCSTTSTAVFSSSAAAAAAGAAPPATAIAPVTPNSSFMASTSSLISSSVMDLMASRIS